MTEFEKITNIWIKKHSTAGRISHHYGQYKLGELTYFTRLCFYDAVVEAGLELEVSDKIMEEYCSPAEVHLFV